jgi:hypothetical protein
VDCDLLCVVAGNVLLGICCALLHRPSVTSLQMLSGPNDMIMGTGLNRFGIAGCNSYHLTIIG